MRVTRSYRLEVAGELSDSVGSSFSGMSMRRTNGNTIFVGPVRDQAELHGLLNRCLALGLTLVSVSSEPNRLVEQDHRTGQVAPTRGR